MKLPHQKAQQSDLHQQQGGKSKAKVPMFRFMPEGAHAQHTAQRPSQHHGEEQGLFGDAPALPACPALVQTHHQKGGKVDRQQI